MSIVLEIKLPLSSNKLLQGNSANETEEVIMNADATMAANGAITIANNAVTYTKTYNGTQLGIVTMFRFSTGN